MPSRVITKNIVSLHIYALYPSSKLLIKQNLFFFPTLHMNFPAYLNKDFNYTKLTKQQLLKILIDNHIDLKVNLNSKKQEILSVYKETIYNRIEELKKKYESLEVARSYVVKKEIDNSILETEEESIYGERREDGRKMSIESECKMSKRSEGEKGYEMNRNNEKGEDVKTRKEHTAEKEMRGGSFNLDNRRPVQNKEVMGKEERLGKEKALYDKNENLNGHNGVVTKSDKQNAKTELPGGNQKAFTKNRIFVDDRDSFLSEETSSENFRVPENMSINKNKGQRQNINKHNEERETANNRNLSKNNIYQANSMTENLQDRKTITQGNNTEHLNKNKNVLGRKRTKTIVLCIFLFIFIPVLAFIKFYCPYCIDHKDIDFFIRNPLKFCINLPDNSINNGGDINCKKDYYLIKRLYAPDYCKKIDKESTKNKILSDIVIILRKRNKEFLLGIRKDNSFDLNELMQIYDAKVDKTKQDEKEVEDDIETKEILLQALMLKYDDIKCINGRIYSTKDVNFIGLVLYKYVRKVFMKVLIPLLILIFAFYLFRSYKKRQQERKELAKRVDNVYKQINRAMINQKQFYLRQRSDIDYVKKQNILDLFDCENKKIWHKVMNKVKRSSNIIIRKVDGEERWEWIGPIIDVDEYMK